jgi:hypothetical protein
VSDDVTYVRHEDLVSDWAIVPFPEIPEEQLLRMVEPIRPIIDEHARESKRMAQRCFIEPSSVFDVARKDAERELFAAVVPDEPKMEGCRW